MQVTVEKLFEGKETTIKSRNFLATKEYTKGFIEEMKKYTKDFIINVQTPNQVTKTGDDIDLTFNRVWVQAIMPEKCDIQGYAETYNLVYGLDVRTPVYKIFKAYKHRTTNNLYAFDSQWLNVYEIKDGEGFTFDIKSLMELTNVFAQKLDKLRGTYLSPEIEDRHELFGKMLENTMLFEYENKGGKVKLTPNLAIKAYQSVYMDSSSKYFVSDTVEESELNYYNAYAQLIQDDKKDIINIFEKSFLIGTLFEVTCE